MLSDNPSSITKYDLGVPEQLLLKAGDAFICSQRMAHYYSKNYSSSISTSIVYFRISHIDHAVLKEPALDSIWLEFKSAQDYVDNDEMEQFMASATEKIDRVSMKDMHSTEDLPVPSNNENSVESPIQIPRVREKEEGNSEYIMISPVSTTDVDGKDCHEI